MLILEERITYTDHDRLFKELVQTFFQEFMEAFFPQEYTAIDFNSVKFLSQEVFTDFPNEKAHSFRGGMRERSDSKCHENRSFLVLQVSKKIVKTWACPLFFYIQNNIIIETYVRIGGVHEWQKHLHRVSYYR